MKNEHLAVYYNFWAHTLEKITECHITRTLPDWCKCSKDPTLCFERSRQQWNACMAHLFKMLSCILQKRLKRFFWILFVINRGKSESLEKEGIVRWVISLNFFLRTLSQAFLHGHLGCWKLWTWYSWILEIISILI